MIAYIKTSKEIKIMNKKIIFVVAILLLVAVAFVACKGNEDTGVTESTTESTTEIDSEIVLHDPSADEGQTLIPELYDPDAEDDEDILYFGDEEDASKGDSISWDEIVGNNS